MLAPFRGSFLAFIFLYRLEICKLGRINLVTKWTTVSFVPFLLHLGWLKRADVGFSLQRKRKSLKCLIKFPWKLIDRVDKESLQIGLKLRVNCVGGENGKVEKNFKQTLMINFDKVINLWTFSRDQRTRKFPSSSSLWKVHQTFRFHV